MASASRTGGSVVAGGSSPTGAGGGRGLVASGLIPCPSPRVKAAAPTMTSSSTTTAATASSARRERAARGRYVRRGTSSALGPRAGIRSVPTSARPGCPRPPLRSRWAAARSARLGGTPGGLAGTTGSCWGTTGGTSGSVSGARGDGSGRGTTGGTSGSGTTGGTSGSGTTGGTSGWGAGTNGGPSGSGCPGRIGGTSGSGTTGGTSGWGPGTNGGPSGSGCPGRIGGVGLRRRLRLARYDGRRLRLGRRPGSPGITGRTSVCGPSGAGRGIGLGLPVATPGPRLPGLVGTGGRPRAQGRLPPGRPGAAARPRAGGPCARERWPRRPGQPCPDLASAGTRVRVLGQQPGDDLGQRAHVLDGPRLAVHHRRRRRQR